VRVSGQERRAVIGLGAHQEGGHHHLGHQAVPEDLHDLRVGDYTGLLIRVRVRVRVRVKDMDSVRANG
jgi:hypothetical protein